MAMIETARKAPFGAITIYRAVDALMSVAKSVSTSFTDYVEARRTVAQLNSLSPRLLEDIGLTRADIDAYDARF